MGPQQQPPKRCNRGNARAGGDSPTGRAFATTLASCATEIAFCCSKSRGSLNRVCCASSFAAVASSATGTIATPAAALDVAAASALAVSLPCSPPSITKPGRDWNLIHSLRQRCSRQPSENLAREGETVTAAHMTPRGTAPPPHACCRSCNCAPARALTKLCTSSHRPALSPLRRLAP